MLIYVQVAAGFIIGWRSDSLRRALLRTSVAVAVIDLLLAALWLSSDAFQPAAPERDVEEVLYFTVGAVVWLTLSLLAAGLGHYLHRRRSPSVRPETFDSQRPS